MKVNDPFKGKILAYTRIKHAHKLIAEPDFDPDCLRCKFDKSESSKPDKDFTVKDFKADGTPRPDKIVKEITLKRGRYDDLIGWSWP